MFHKKGLCFCNIVIAIKSAINILTVQWRAERGRVEHQARQVRGRGAAARDHLLHPGEAGHHLPRVRARVLDRARRVSRTSGGIVHNFLLSIYSKFKIIKMVNQNNYVVCHFNNGKIVVLHYYYVSLKTPFRSTNIKYLIFPKILSLRLQSEFEEA